MVKKHLSNFKKEFKKHSLTAILTAFGFLIALVWRDFITESLNKIVENFGITNQLAFYKLIIAVLITILAILGIMIISKLQAKEDENTT
jgi:ABC-type polysaccharide/polyol phosphate export permease